MFPFHTIRRIYDGLTQGQKRSRKRTRSSLRPRLEMLEDRTPPTRVHGERATRYF
jgi:hypothetical protein